jgi:ketosteroid isomerase-like protein
MRATMKRILLPSLLATALLGSTAEADQLDQGTASRFVDAFYKAVQRHDLAAVSSMIDDNAKIEVLWVEADPPQKFVLSKADFLQQMRANWHFATSDSYQLRNLNVSRENGIATVTVQENESRILFGTKAGQNNQLQIRLTGENESPRIAAISSKTVLW